MGYLLRTLVIKKIVMIAILMLCALANASVPSTINYQGYLTDSAGEPINQTQTITFRIYSQANGGIELWSDTKSLAIDQGAFSTELGDGINAFPNNLFDGPLFLGISVNTDAEMSPRTSLTSAPFALNAERLGGQTAADLSYTDAEAVTAMGVRSNSNPFNHSRYTDTNARAAMGTRSNTNDLNHDRYTDTEARSAMGTRSDSNDLNHDKYTNANAVAAIKAADGAGSNLDADLLDGMQASDIIAAASAPQGTAITGPTTITSGGRYYLANDISSTSTGVISISAPGENVILDLNNKTISSTSVAAGSSLVRLFSTSTIEIMNGTIQGVVGALSPQAILTNSTAINRLVLKDLTIVDTSGVTVGGNGACFIENNIINGDSTNTGFSTPSIESRGLGMTCRNGFVQNNVVTNSVFTGTTASGTGGMNLNGTFVVKNNVIRNVLLHSGVCFRLVRGLATQNVTSGCETNSANDAGDVLLSSGATGIDNAEG